MALFAVGTGAGCTATENRKGECTELVRAQRRQVIAEVLDELDHAADSIEGSLDIQVAGGLDRAQERALRKVQGQLRVLLNELDLAFRHECI